MLWCSDVAPDQTEATASLKIAEACLVRHFLTSSSSFFLSLVSLDDEKPLENASDAGKCCPLLDESQNGAPGASLLKRNKACFCLLSSLDSAHSSDRQSQSRDSKFFFSPDEILLMFPDLIVHPMLNHPRSQCTQTLPNPPLQPFKTSEASPSALMTTSCSWRAIPRRRSPSTSSSSLSSCLHCRVEAWLSRGALRPCSWAYRSSSSLHWVKNKAADSSS